MTSDPLKILILGQGRFGKLWGRCLMPLGSIQAYDPQASAELSPYLLLRDRAELQRAILQCDVLFFCVPISELKALLEQLQAAFALREQAFKACKISNSPSNILRNTLGNTLGNTSSNILWLMDTCSVKVQPMQWLQQAIPTSAEAAIRYLGLHPMFGPDSARDSLDGQRLVLCPPPQHDEPQTAIWRQFFEKLGLRVIEMSADAHDEEAAHTQGLTHLLGRVLEAFDMRESPIATTGYQALCKLREQTCNDTWQLFLDLQHQNSYTPVMRQKLQESLAKIYTSLEK